MSFRWKPIGLATVALILGAWLGACGRPLTASELEHRVEDRVLAPCCWRQPLRDHESELAAALRLEVRQRVEAGESAAAIEASLVQRYGERIRALPSGSDPRWMIVALFSALAGMGLLALWRLVRPHSTMVAVGGPFGGGPRGNPSSDPRDAEYQHRLDDDLSELD